MRKSLFSIVTGLGLLSGVALSAAQTTTTATATRQTPAQGTAIARSSTTPGYASFSDPALAPTIDMVRPCSVTMCPLPATAVALSPGAYSNTIIDNQPVVVDSTTRQVVHTWQK